VHLDQSDGTLTLRTGVTGAAAPMGHRLTIVFDAWRIDVTADDGRPVSGSLVVDIDSLRVVGGEGGVTPLSGPEQGIVRSNALKTLDARKFPTAEFRAAEFTRTGAGYRLHGPLTLHGRTREIDVDVAVAESGGALELTARAEVSHRAFGIKPYSMAMGALKVADIVTVEFAARAVR